MEPLNLLKDQSRKLHERSFDLSGNHIDRKDIYTEDIIGNR